MCSVSSVIEKRRQPSTDIQNPDYCSYESTSSPLSSPSRLPDLPSFINVNHLEPESEKKKTRNT